MLSTGNRLFITSTLWSLSTSRISLASHISFRGLNTFPNMSAITDNDIVARFEKLSLSKPQIYEHAPVANGAQWKAELEKIGKGNVTLTKTVRAPQPFHKVQAHLPSFCSNQRLLNQQPQPLSSLSPKSPPKPTRVQLGNT